MLRCPAEWPVPFPAPVRCGGVSVGPPTCPWPAALGLFIFGLILGTLLTFLARTSRSRGNLRFPERLSPSCQWQERQRTLHQIGER